jgi:negative modulator of initiation of replication
MPETIAIDDDVYNFLRAHIQDFRETESSVLRRLLQLAPSVHQAVETERPTAGAPGGNGHKRPQPLVDCLSTARVQLARNATEKFLSILSWAHEQNPTTFDRVLPISGRRRRYFAQSRQEITESGTHTYPQRIPDSPYWVMTNADTFQKRDILRKALGVLGYASAEIQAVASAVR